MLHVSSNLVHTVLHNHHPQIKEPTDFTITNVDVNLRMTELALYICVIIKTSSQTMIQKK